MPEWLIVVLAVMAVPLAVIVGGLTVVGLAIWLGHKNKMAKLEVAEKERQAEIDRELLGLGSKDISAHLETLLDRMNAVEKRLDKVESMQDIEAAKSRSRVPITSSEEDSSETTEREQREIA